MLPVPLTAPHLLALNNSIRTQDHKTSLESHSYKPCSSSRLSPIQAGCFLCACPKINTPLLLVVPTVPQHMSSYGLFVCIADYPPLSVPWVQSLSSSWATPASSFKGSNSDLELPCGLGFQEMPPLSSRALIAQLLCCQHFLALLSSLSTVCPWPSPLSC